MFEVRDLSASYGGAAILQGVSFSLTPGTVTGLLGANGSGKTTLLKAICGILPHAGTCMLDGKPLEGLSARHLARQVSYIPQRSGISIDLTALEVVLMGYNPQLKLLQQPTAQMAAMAAELLKEVGIDPSQNYLHLSEGQKQLCMLARARAGGGKLLLLDEPESALDVKNRYAVFGKMSAWAQDKIVLAALHDPQLALQHCQRLLVLNNGGVEAVLYPETDEISHMEQALRRIYGPVRLHRIDGRPVMVVKGEDVP